jgi:16S rRNA (cytosine967-C5)-methyltransferase
LLAFEVLHRRGATPLRTVERVARREELDARDRALLRRLVATEVRRRGTLRALAQHLAERKLDADLALHARIGLAQIFFLDKIPDHAALSETVSAAMESLSDRHGRVVNAMLRNALRLRASGASGDPRRDLPLRELHIAEPVFHDPREHLFLWMEEALSIPVALAKRWVKRYGEERAKELAILALREPDLSLRVARRAVLDDGGRVRIESRDRETVRTELERELALATGTIRDGIHPRVLVTSHAHVAAIVRSTLFEHGAITIQGETALRAAELVDAQPREKIIDLCAAPGGKTAVLLEAGCDVTARDASAARFERLTETLARFDNPASTLHAEIAEGASGLEPESFDAVLVDAPCSDTGVLAARPEARWRFGRESLAALAELQAHLLREAATCVRRGGRLVYSTCSIEPEENQRRVRAFLAEHAELTLEREIESLPAASGTSGPVDGGYAARLLRR